jgi:hypothetical protein
MGIRRTDGKRIRDLMVAYVFDTILKRGSAVGVAPKMKRDSRDWFRKQAQATAASPTRMLASDRSRLTARPMIGSMYLFNYDPKGKKTLPYYDRYPLVIPIGSAKTTGFAASGGSFLGLNLHYLPLPLRARLMDALYTTASSKTLDENTKLKVSYNILVQASKYRFFQPCIKRYLISHVRSKFFYIEPTEWNMALFLPFDRFVGSNKTRIYRDSRNRI